ncbi:MAG: 4-hydroxythreonine-4-phosphate dehydrogenase PdxA [Elusimicrobia bacterium]|nr:4-hydroxythreonine-4-phosphate dehydrogenase PdxA [Elusimicrobiota bacterium]
MARSRPILAFTMGDPGGIGPEVVVGALRDRGVRRSADAIVVGSRAVMRRRGWGERLAPLLDPGVGCRGVLGKPTADGGRASFESVRLALGLYVRGIVDGIVTAPVSKEAWVRARAGHSDHTGFFESACGVRGAMVLLAGRLRSVLVTRHIPLSRVPRRLTVSGVVEAGTRLFEALRELGLRRPRLGVCALNPHAGEHGILGGEEESKLKPAIARLRSAGVNAGGPYPADAAWAAHARGSLDGLVALYHDQALIPLKIAEPYGVVNWTVGLPLVRTSPGHGTAYDIAGKRPARPDATIAAARLAAALAACLLVAPALPALGAAAGAERKILTPTEIVDIANKVLRGDSSHGRLTMTVVTPSWTRELTIEGWNQGREKAFILIHSPAKDKGNTTLRRKNEMWLWMPKVERVVKVPPTMMHSSWQGSDFTYEDIVKADSVVKDYTHKVLRVTDKGDHDVYEIEATPKPDAPVVWGRVLLWSMVYPDGTVLPLKEEDYSERGEKIRTVALSEIELMDGLRVPTRLECTPHRKPGQKTVMKYHDIDFNINAPDSFFSLERLQRSR